MTFQEITRRKKLCTLLFVRLYVVESALFTYQLQKMDLSSELTKWKLELSILFLGLNSILMCTVYFNFTSNTTGTWKIMIITSPLKVFVKAISLLIESGRWCLTCVLPIVTQFVFAMFLRKNQKKGAKIFFLWSLLLPNVNTQYRSTRTEMERHRFRSNI